MPVPLYVGNTPNRLTGPETFSADTDIYHAWLPTAITAWNADIAALNTNDTRDTSTSSVLIGVGTKVFTVSTGKSFSAGQWLTISSTSSPTNQMIANVTSYSGSTLTVTVPSNGVKGSGTLAAWTIALTAAPSDQIAAHFLPVTSAADMSASRTAMDVYSKAEAAAVSALKSIDYTLSGNANTLKLNPTTLSFRSTTLTSGAPVSVSNAAQITTTISSGSTGGTVSGQQSDIVLLAINNAGTMELAWTNLAGGLNLDETNLINTVAEGGAGAADSASTIYSTTARTGVAYRVVGIFRSTQTTAGTWAQAPSLVQGIGGQALAALSGLGYGQTWQSVIGSRALGTTYYNTTGRPIYVVVGTNQTGAGTGNFVVAGISLGATAVPSVASTHVNSAVVPAGASYSMVGSNVLLNWHELR